MDEYITVQDAAKLVCVHEQTIRKWIREKTLKAFTRPGFARQVFVRSADVEKFKGFKAK